MREPKQFVLYFVTILIGAAVAFLLGEVVLRIYQSVNPVFVFPDRSYNRFRGKPYADDYSFKLNSHGFKDVEFQLTKQPGQLRILSIGDSFLFGVVPYEYNFLTLLEDRLKRQGRPVEVINMGIPGTSPRDYLAIYLHEGFGLNPDMVLVGLFVGNDLEESGTPPHFQSYVVSLIRYFIAARKHWNGNIVHGAKEYHDDEVTMSESKYLEIEAARSHIFRKKNPAFEGVLRNTVSYLEVIHDLCRQRHSDLLVLVIPDELQVSRDLQRKIMEQVKLPATDEWDFRLPNRILSMELQKRGILFIDLLDTFQAMSTKQVLYKRQDSHWNIAGNQIAAEALAERVSSILD